MIQQFICEKKKEHRFKREPVLFFLDQKLFLLLRRVYDTVASIVEYHSRGLNFQEKWRMAMSQNVLMQPTQNEPRRGLSWLHVLFTGIVLLDRKSTRLNSSHSQISYAVFCLR